jgi:hypothetical protein
VHLTTCNTRSTRSANVNSPGTRSAVPKHSSEQLVAAKTTPKRLEASAVAATCKMMRMMMATVMEVWLRCWRALQGRGVAGEEEEEEEKEEKVEEVARWTRPKRE